ncbi:inverse autotransporter beta domain-containing protein [bacterium endosymbiont of Bathymodiolus sp. 5 South]|uniref:inverse autotransporter beta domain-containing protein n=1 Tax=bacterium endosymbiont of Bathymodiolus sp. 5 South TaxID=1181670 RepID=UPI0010B3D467|nr:inverse autotransporter beta domain-containing protein [bacterium endosymbiont of Bathymodiolus sp. 5 South]SHN89438.1 hypothetical protein BCLUESOX_900 [bacterium endosymbiont of Bathymodiolus sp. 5 South]
MKNTVKFQLNHFFKNTLSSVFNQFKHFLALSLLITFSFNAFSVDDSQQFNKEAYLDLSKPYQQNNPQPTPKKDNQATTILKEVAGATRTALGSTNSDNTDQLGNKVTTSIKNQAVNKTEGLLNNSVNEFLNAFGAGRSEVSIGGISTKKLNYSLKTIQPLSELNANSKELTFIQAGIASGDSGNGRRATINLGIGHRLLVEDDMAIAGINVFTDYQTKSSHKRLSLGLEYQRANFSANINKYHIFSDKKLVNGSQKRALSGYDVKLSGQVPYLPWAKIKGTYYYWDAKTGSNIRGNILGVDIELTPSVSFEFGQENNNTINATSYGKLTVKLPLGNKQKFTNFSIASKAFKDSHKMDLGALAWVERTNKIIETEAVFTGGLFNGLTYALVTSPDTGKVWLDRNLGARQVCTSSTDEACYGDLYQWGRAKDGHESRTSGNKAILATTITPATSMFINSKSPWDWTSIDSSGASRIDAWANGGANDICPAGFSVPTEAELAADTISANITGNASAFSSFLRIPVAGYRDRENGSVSSVRSSAYLWSRSANGVNGRGLNITVSIADFNSNNSNSRALGFSVRCIRD